MKRKHNFFMPWISQSRRSRVHKFRWTTKQSVVLVLVLTSLWWLSFNILYLLHANSAFGEINKNEEKRHIGPFTPPTHEHHIHQNGAPFPLYAPTGSGVKIENTPIYKVIGFELYPELVIPRLGNNGYPAKLPDSLLSESKVHFTEHSFDSVLSDRISLNRQLQDYRGKLCKQKESIYPSVLPLMSIIICFHNEALSALLRTVHSIINRTPSRVLSSIILVDDASILDSLGQKLEEHISHLNQNWQNKIVLLRNKKREGLVRSRLKGAEKADGDVLMFLDSHCEVTVGWAEPLLSRILENRKNVVSPVIEVIDSKDLSYKNTETKDIIQVGSFTWDLFFNWKAISPADERKRLDETSPLKSPAMAGGLFAMDRSYFYELGSYDDQMEIWGGENIELSFRIWMCGGNLEIIPCSRVGHIFRYKDSPYSFPDGVDKTLNKNFNRLAEVWMDEYKEKYYKRKSKEQIEADIGDLTARKKLRQRLKCKSFDWYIKNIVPGMLGADANPPASGEVRNINSGKCLDTIGEKGMHTKVHASECRDHNSNQQFVVTKNKEITFDDRRCLDYSLSNEMNQVELWNCHSYGGNQAWVHDRKSGLIIHHVSGRCMTNNDDDHVTIETCNSKKNSQQWTFSHYRNDSAVT